MRLLTIFVLLVLAAPASAATVRTTEGEAYPQKGAGWTTRIVEITAAPGERNDVHVTVAGGAVHVRDAAGALSIGGACRPEPGGAVCAVPPALRDVLGRLSVRADLSDGDDALVVDREGRSRPNAVVTLGDGNDRVTGATQADGGPGDDSLQAWTMTGGTGADTFLGPGSAEYTDPRTEGVAVTLDGLANDGAPGERDDVRTRKVIGTPHGDTLVGGPAGDELHGGGGIGDRVLGGPGDDSLSASASYALGNEVGWAAVVDGGPGDDSVSAHSSREDAPGNTLRGGPGDDALRSHFGADTLDGGPGVDQLESGTGDDVLVARDGNRDTVDCGAGRDTIAADVLDWPGACETIDRGGAAARAVLRFANLDTRSWNAGVGCPPDHRRACVVTLQVGDRRPEKPLRVRPGDAPVLTAPKGRLRRGTRVVLTTTDARGRPRRQVLRLR